MALRLLLPSLLPLAIILPVCIVHYNLYNTLTYVQICLQHLIQQTYVSFTVIKYFDRLVIFTMISNINIAVLTVKTIFFCKPGIHHIDIQ